MGLELILLLLTTPWVILALLAAFSDAGVGFIDEWLLKQLNTEQNEAVDAPGRLVLISGFFGLLVALGTLLVTVFLNDSYTLDFSRTTILFGISAGALEVMWLIPYFYALQRGGAINTTPLFQTVPIFSLLFGLLIFNEVPIINHILAALIIIIGAAILNYSPETKSLDRKTIGLMLISSVLISIGLFFFKDAAEISNFVSALFWNGLGMFALSTLIWIGWRPYREQFLHFIQTLNPKIFGLQFANESLYTFSAITGHLAIVLGPTVMVVTAFDGFHPVFTLFIGILLACCGSKQHKKDFAGWQWVVKIVAIVLITFGALLIVS